MVGREMIILHVLVLTQAAIPAIPAIPAISAMAWVSLRREVPQG